MGIEILSFTIKDVYDTVDYLASLGKSQTAAVIRDADITVAHSNRDAGIQEAECQKVLFKEIYSYDFWDFYQFNQTDNLIISDQNK